MAVSAERVTVSTTAVALQPAESGVAGGRLFVKNAGAEDLVLGAADVTTSSGFALAAGGTLEIPYSYGERIYAVCATSVTAHVLRLGE
jgi:hypothetical protein